jgi:hypothetical protein
MIGYAISTTRSVANGVPQASVPSSISPGHPLSRKTDGRTGDDIQFIEKVQIS